MSSPYRIIEVPADAATAIEAMGTKPKFWFTDESGRRFLYKRARSETGEHWAEKVAAELASLLAIPHASYELADCGGALGVVTPMCIPETAQLYHGNEFLLRNVPGYPGSLGGEGQFYKVSQHTLDLVLGALVDYAVERPHEHTVPDGIATGVDVFVGYLMLDAWIGNTDRHHENWAFYFYSSNSPLGHDPHTLFLAPTFDHASSLGRELTDQERRARLATKDRGYSVEAYVEKARSALYDRQGDPVPLLTIEAFCGAADRFPAAARLWLSRLTSVRAEDVKEVTDRLPERVVTPTARAFAVRILDLNRDRLLSVKGPS